MPSRQRSWSQWVPVKHPKQEYLLSKFLRVWESMPLAVSSQEMWFQITVEVPIGRKCHSPPSSPSPPPHRHRYRRSAHRTHRTAVPCRARSRPRRSTCTLTFPPGTLPFGGCLSCHTQCYSIFSCCGWTRPRSLWPHCPRGCEAPLRRIWPEEPGGWLACGDLIWSRRGKDCPHIWCCSCRGSGCLPSPQSQQVLGQVGLTAGNSDTMDVFLMERLGLRLSPCSFRQATEAPHPTSESNQF